VRPAGAWSLLLDAAAMGLDSTAVAQRLLDEKVAVTPMVEWGRRGGRPSCPLQVQQRAGRPAGLVGERVRRALDAMEA
jgi:hypothetical protein